MTSKGRVGMVCLITAEASLFAVFVVAYLYDLGKSLSGPAPGEVLSVPLLGTVCLLSSSVTVALAVRALGRGAVRRSGAWLLATVLLAVVFLTGTAAEWWRLVTRDGLTIGTNLFGTTFYALVGLHASHVIVGLVARDRRQVVSDLVALTKPRVVVMVLVTTLVGYDVGLTGSADYLRMIHLLIGTLLAASGTLALNQYWERDVDARMDRTRTRPLPAGRLQPLEALLFGVALTMLGAAYLAALVGAVVALVIAATAILYLFAYTPLKRRSPLCTLVGAVPGALPPVAGWAAARGDVALGAWVLFGVLFLWQLPHTLSIARLYREDYARAGVRVLPVIDPDGASTERQIVLACVGLLTVSLLPTVIGWTGPIYLAGALVLGLAFVAVGMMQALAPSARSARWVLLVSLLYLPLLLGLLAFDRI